MTSEPGRGIGGHLGSTLELRRSAHTERAMVIEHREPLLYMIGIAAELEHALMCEYLYAAFSLKRRADEGLTPAQLQRVGSWRAAVLQVARQEMLHLAITCNLSVSLGGSPHLSRPNLPQPARHYPSGVRLTLLPFGEAALRHFLFLERPEDVDLDDAECVAAVECAVPVTGADEIAPHLQEFQTVGHLYRAIEAGFGHLAEKLGEDRLFLGARDAQTGGARFGWPELQPIVDLAGAVRAIESIVAQGEGTRGNWREAHFGRFLDVLNDYLDFTAEFPEAQVTRPVLPVLVRPPETGDGFPLISDTTTARVADLGNVAYEVLLQLLYRLMARVDESEEQAATLARTAVALMVEVIDPLADILTAMPVGPEHPGSTAGPTFELFYQPDYLLPHRRSGWLLMAEHLRDAEALTRQLAPADARLEGVAAALAHCALVLETGAV